MRKIKEVLRLRYELKLDQRQIARSCSISVSTVHEYLKRAEEAKVSWPPPDGWDDAHLEAALYPCPEAKPQSKKSPPDYAAVHEQLRTHRHVTLQLLWEEYREANPDGYRYSRYVAAIFMLPWNADPSGVLLVDGTYGNINRPRGGAIDLSRTPSTTADACVGVQTQPTP
jgi:hypothetical protein